ncbi:uncharacterized protein [Dermacentor albipictus]|uniref:uncharacterized protein isoform X2 n=1 Tax=Dermacentor albipictus TaxID=60249 RepID=UPI0038FCA2B3
MAHVDGNTMEQLLKLPEPLLLSGNIAKNWELFQQKFELFLDATESPKEPRTTAAKTALLLSTAGDDALETCYQGLQGQRLRTTPTTRKMWRSTRLQSCQPWYDFSHVTSSPEFPRSNGLAEKGVQIVKRILKKTEETKQDFWLGLLNYRSTPLEDGRSPGELLQGRRLRTLLPDFRQQPSIPVFKRAQADTRARTLPPLNTGDVVRVQEKTWNRRAQVTEAVAPRSYQLVTARTTECYVATDSICFQLVSCSSKKPSNVMTGRANERVKHCNPRHLLQLETRL